MADPHPHISAQKARSGEISGRVRNVLIASTALAVVILGVIASFWIA